jgi:Chromosome segregation ATPases
MLEEFLSEFNFPLQKLYGELDKKQLLFLHLCGQNHDRVKELFGSNNLFDLFYEMASDQDVVLRKIKKQDVVKNLIEEHEQDTKGLVQILYYEFYKPDVILPDGLLKGIYLVVDYIFCQNLREVFMNMVKNKSGGFRSVLDSYFLKDKHILNFLGAIALIAKIDNFSTHFDSDDIEESIYGIKNSLMERVMYYYYQINIDEVIEHNKNSVTIEKKINKLTRDLEKNKEMLAKNRQLSKTLTAEKKELNGKIKELSKEKPNNDTELVTQLLTDLRKKDDVIEQKDKEIKAVKEKPSTMYTTLINDLNNQILTQKEQNRTKTGEIKDLKSKLFKYENREFNEYLSQQLVENALSDKSFEIIKPYYEKYINDVALREAVITTEVEVPKKVSHIGYCVIENQTHYIVLPIGKKMEIINIPENTYLAENQFILIDEDGNFRWAFQYKYDAYDTDYLIKRYASSVDGIRADKGDGILEQINRLPQSVRLRDKQIIALSADNNYIRYYMPLKYNADYFLESALIKGHTLSYVLKVFPQGCLLRNIETSEEYFKDVDRNGFELKEQIIVILKEDKIINIITFSKFYTLSSYYKNMQYGTIEIKDERVLLRKLSDEIVLVNEVPTNIELVTGQVINIDEYNNYLSLRFEDTPEELRKPFLNSVSYKKNKNNRDQRESIELNKSVCIIGNISFENNYKLSCCRIGYKAEVIDGYEPWEKIRTQIKDVDLVIVISSFVSHDNMWRLKDQKDIPPVLYPGSDGANRITNEIIKYDEKQIVV